MYVLRTDGEEEKDGEKNSIDTLYFWIEFRQVFDMPNFPFFFGYKN